MSTKVCIKWASSIHPLLPQEDPELTVEWNPLQPLPVEGEHLFIYIGFDAIEVEVVVERRRAGIIYQLQDRYAQMMTFLWIRRA